MTKQLRNALALVLLAVFAPAVRAGDAGADYDRWFTILMNGKPAGWDHAATRTDGGKITTTQTMHLALARNGVAVPLDIAATTVETPEGLPVELTLVEKTGLTQMTQAWAFKDGQIEVTSTQAGQTRTATRPVPKDKWLTPQARCRYVKEQLAAGAKEIKYRTLDPEVGPDPILTTAKVIGPCKVEAAGKIVPAVECEVVMSNMPGVASRWFVDADGHEVKADLPEGGVTFTLVEADRQAALARINPPDLIDDSLIPSDKLIPNARQAREAVYELKIAEPKAGQPDPPITLPRGGSQRVVWSDQRTASVVVDLSQPVNPVADLPKAADSAASRMVDCDDPKVVKLLGEALKGVPAGAPPSQRAEALRKFVYGFIDKKDLRAGLASATEVARTAGGDCKAHAILLAALLRAAKIPARVVSGLVYSDHYAGRRGVFGYHMWTRAWLSDATGGASGGTSGGASGGGWVDLDAMLSRTDAFDATHIALTVTSLDDAGVASEFIKIVPLIGRLSIRVVEVKP